MKVLSALEPLREECELVSKALDGLSEEDFAMPTRCSAWNVKELLAHMYRGVDRINVGLEAPPPEEPDADSVSYWGRYEPIAEGADIADRAKHLAAAFGSGRDLALSWDPMWRRAMDAAERAGPNRLVVTWGPALELDEFLRTRVLEITVHRLDLEVAFGRKGWGTDQAISIVDDILVGLLGLEPPAELEWDAIDFIEAGTGRRALNDDERSMLGPLAERFPLLG
jgi:uncharacterized protein (TIGR03083 family)